MFERLKKALVESFVGAIGLGWLFAQGVLHFAYVFTGPLAGWISSREYFALTSRVPSPGFWFRDSLLELARSLALLLLAYVLLRWLYFKPPQEVKPLFQPDDAYHPQQEGGKISPNPEDPPENRFEGVLAWYRDWCAKAAERAVEDDPLMALRGSGKALWADEHANHYVRRLREGWE